MAVMNKAVWHASSSQGAALDCQSRHTADAWLSRRCGARKRPPPTRPAQMKSISVGYSGWV